MRWGNSGKTNHAEVMQKSYWVWLNAPSCKTNSLPELRTLVKNGIFFLLLHDEDTDAEVITYATSSLFTSRISLERDTLAEEYPNRVVNSS